MGIIVKRLTAELEQSKAERRVLATIKAGIRFPWSTWKRIYGRSWLETLSSNVSSIVGRSEWRSESLLKCPRYLCNGSLQSFRSTHFPPHAVRIALRITSVFISNLWRRNKLFSGSFQLHIVRALLRDGVESQAEQTLVEDILAIVKQYLLLIIYDSGLITALNRFLCAPLPRPPPHAHREWERTKITINIVGNRISWLLSSVAHDFDGEECEKKKRFRSTCANDGNFSFSPLVSFFLLLPQPSLSPPLSISRSRKARRIEGNHTQPVCGEHIKIKS